MKGGSRELTLLEELPLPVITTESLVRYAIFCGQAVVENKFPKWSLWAKRWLSSADRTIASARAAAIQSNGSARAAAWVAERAAARATRAAATEAAWVADTAARAAAE
jgi:hypothetical protein